MNHLFPIFVKLEQFNVLIVGGGFVGHEKITALLSNSPKTPITLIGREIRQDIYDYVADFPQVVLKQKIFELNDLLGQQIVIAATDDKKVNEDIRNAAKERGILVNVADTPDLCDFYLSSIVQKGDLKIAISSNGKSPTITKRLKQVFQDTLPNEIDTILQNMAAIRAKLKGDFAQKIKTLNQITENLVQ
ncbi:MAG: hypothetical protein RL329_2438 [Bacteroidota bacterium]|jgi:siroheme synthase-like protein